MVFKNSSFMFRIMIYKSIFSRRDKFSKTKNIWYILLGKKPEIVFNIIYDVLLANRNFLL